MAEKKDLVAARAEFTGAARGGSTVDPKYDEARASLADSSARATTEELKATQRATDLEAEGKTSFLSELGSTRSLITGAASLGALLAGEDHAALGLLAGGLLGTSQRADSINAMRTEGVSKQEASARASRGQAITAQTSILSSAQGLEQQQYGSELELVSQFLGNDFAKEAMLTSHRWDVEDKGMHRAFQIQLMNKEEAARVTAIEQKFGMSILDIEASGGWADLEAEDQAWITQKGEEARLAMDMVKSERINMLPGDLSKQIFGVSNAELVKRERALSLIHI